jgi:hypothetical protein
MVIKGIVSKDIDFTQGTKVRELVVGRAVLNGVMKFAVRESFLNTEDP